VKLNLFPVENLNMGAGEFSRKNGVVRNTTKETKDMNLLLRRLTTLFFNGQV